MKTLSSCEESDRCNCGKPLLIERMIREYSTKFTHGDNREAVLIIDDVVMQSPEEFSVTYTSWIDKIHEYESKRE